VENGAAALAHFAARPFDVVLMDVQMPDVDGLTATRRIREAEAHHGSNTPIPIICLTAYVSDHERNELIEAGANEIVHKPTSQAALARALASVKPVT
ncbi:MAG: response regulator, partial [Spirochaetales bacterium]